MTRYHRMRDDAAGCGGCGGETRASDCCCWPPGAVAVAVAVALVAVAVVAVVAAVENGGGGRRAVANRAS